MGRLVNRFVSWLQEGYPDGVPRIDRVPLIALLTQEVSPAPNMQVAE